MGIPVSLILELQIQYVNLIRQTGCSTWLELWRRFLDYSYILRYSSRQAENKIPLNQISKDPPDKYPLKDRKITTLTKPHIQSPAEIHISMINFSSS